MLDDGCWMMDDGCWMLSKKFSDLQCMHLSSIHKQVSGNKAEGVAGTRWGLANSGC